MAPLPIPGSSERTWRVKGDASVSYSACPNLGVTSLDVTKQVLPIISAEGFGTLCSNFPRMGWVINFVSRTATPTSLVMAKMIVCQSSCGSPVSTAAAKIHHAVPKTVIQMINGTVPRLSDRNPTQPKPRTESVPESRSMSKSIPSKSSAPRITRIQYRQITSINSDAG